ncbi:uncharacterized protein PADG_11251 [Paracoccidioides brasiliensis Pb18]|uniref:Uncharacterized protein n=1 Tax=Paracoccidioides brasiliensis (strain Pb18) TaxID=502780 RepID=A0A0A0HYI6_PARBD|nr:uncharacterized protein PADG_11251 [Paracoccidioides brasiliensis Pb18]KGM92435.1 hypothetical protein PADG_11251 [Paracoccidioides brasiliensis Pb18]
MRSRPACGPFVNLYIGIRVWQHRSPFIVQISGAIASAFGVSTAIFAVFFFGEVPRVRKDILMKIPIIGGYWERSIPPEDNRYFSSGE